MRARARARVCVFQVDVVKVKVEVCMVQWCAYEGKREGEGSPSGLH